MNTISATAKREKIILIALVLAGLAGLLTFIALYESAFPSASLDLKITRNDAIKIASEFLANQGQDVSDYEKVAMFGHNSNTKE